MSELELVWLNPVELDWPYEDGADDEAEYDYENDFEDDYDYEAYEEYEEMDE